MILRIGRKPGRRGAAFGSSRVACALAVLCLAGAAVAGCGSGGDNPGPSITTTTAPRGAASGNDAGPLVTTAPPRGAASCMPVPNPVGHVDTWHTPVAFNLDMFLNQAHVPLTIESVTLIDPHNLILEGAIVYEMPHSRYPLAVNAAVADEAAAVPAALWARHQKVPGAVIGPGHSAPIDKVLSTTDLYQIAPEVSLAMRAGGWALGEIVTYQAGGHEYTVEAQTGYAIGSPLVPAAQSCNGPFDAIQAQWHVG
jgi:hypothetical protein